MGIIGTTIGIIRTTIGIIPNTFFTRLTNALVPYDYPRMLYGCARSTATQTRERPEAAARACLN